MVQIFGRGATMRLIQFPDSTRRAPVSTVHARPTEQLNFSNERFKQLVNRFEPIP